MNNKYVVLGAGMSGLAAAKALEDMNLDFDILDKDISYLCRKEGLHYLHDNMGLKLKRSTLKYITLRDAYKSRIQDCILYSQKIWNNSDVLDNSICDIFKTLSGDDLSSNKYVNLHPYKFVYSFNEAYFKLKRKFWKKTIQCRVDTDNISEIKNKYKLVICTIPLNVLYPDIECKYELMWGNSRFPKDLYLDDNMVAYNLQEGVSWYRCSRIFDEVWTEYTVSNENFLNTTQMHPIRKIITADFDKSLIEKDGIILAGRYAEWDRKRLVHEVYYNIKRRLMSDV
jgi:hypothetical protein